MKSKWFHHISFTKYIFPFLTKMIALHQNVANCQNILTVLTLRRIFLQDVWMSQMRMTNADTTQDNFILPAPPVGRLQISQDWLDRMKFVRERTIAIILPSGKNILADAMFKIIIENWNGKENQNNSNCIPPEKNHTQKINPKTHDKINSILHEKVKKKEKTHQQKPHTQKHHLYRQD